MVLPQVRFHRSHGCRLKLTTHTEVIGAEALRNTHSEANELIPLTKNEVDESMSSVDGDQALSGQTQSLSADKPQNETGEHEENGVSSGNDLEDAPSLENSKCEQDTIDNGRETATDKASTENPSLVYVTRDIRTSATDRVDQYVSELATAKVDDVTKIEGDMARLEKNLNGEILAREVKREDLDGEKNETQHEHQESPTLSGPGLSKSSQRHGLNSTMHAKRLQTQRNSQLGVADTINQVGAASNEFFEVPDTRGPEGPTRSGINYALQHYQMQLMSLERTNKMRLMLARQEQDGVGETNSDDKPGESTVHAASAPQELPDTTVETRSCGGNDSTASHGFKARL